MLDGTNRLAQRISTLQYCHRKRLRGEVAKKTHYKTEFNVCYNKLQETELNLMKESGNFFIRPRKKVTVAYNIKNC